MGQKIKNILNLIIKGILEIIYPMDSYCIICKEEADGICKKCLKNITFCEKEELCIGYYKGVLKQLILKLKYKKDFVAGEILADLIKDKLIGYDDYYLTYIPMTKNKIKQRGFNQCEYISSRLSQIVNLKSENTLVKVKETKNQKTLIKEERIKNLIGAFEIRKGINVKNKNYILIDDVITTGATINEAKKILKNNGANKIKILTLAKSHI